MTTSPTTAEHESIALAALSEYGSLMGAGVDQEIFLQDVYSALLAAENTRAEHRAHLERLATIHARSAAPPTSADSTPEAKRNDLYVRAVLRRVGLPAAAFLTQHTIASVTTTGEPDGDVDPALLAAAVHELKHTEQAHA